LKSHRPAAAAEIVAEGKGVARHDIERHAAATRAAKRFGLR